MGTVCCSLFFAVNFAPQYLMGGAGGKFFHVACYVTYGRMACGTLSISKESRGRKTEFVLGEIYVLYGGANVLFL